MRKPIPAALVLVLVWTFFRLIALHHDGAPPPQVHDEFSYLLGADTFAHGRLANPPLELGRFFESPHILVRPVYASKYPPGQAMFLALGQRLFGSPIYGVMLGNAFMLFSLCLMLFAWIAYPWPLAVTAMAGLCVFPPMYWANSYWGGSVATGAAALVLLAVGLYRNKQSSSAGAVFAFGALLLFWTRPFEGGVFVLAVLLVFGRELWQKRRAGVAVAALLVAIPGIAWTGRYNQAITGSPFRLPYLLHDIQYNVTPPFSFLPLRPQPVYSHPRLAAQHGHGGFEEYWYNPARPRWRVIRRGYFESLMNLLSWFGPALLITLFLPVGWGDSRYRRMAVITAIVLFALGLETFHMEHYGAPAWPAIALMIAVWAERAWPLRLGKFRVGAFLVVLALLARSLLLILIPGPPPLVWPVHRVALIERLSALKQRQLVIVRYPAPGWHILTEWVYNSADIDGQRVIFAHDLGPVQNQALLSHYSDRAVSLLTFDPTSGQESLQPYSGAPI